MSGVDPVTLLQPKRRAVAQILQEPASDEQLDPLPAPPLRTDITPGLVAVDAIGVVGNGEEDRQSAGPSNTASSVASAPAGICRVIELTATFVARMGPQFERRILCEAAEASNMNKFAFLAPAHIYHPCYREALERKLLKRHDLPEIVKRSEEAQASKAAQPETSYVKQLQEYLRANGRTTLAILGSQVKRPAGAQKLKRTLEAHEDKFFISDWAVELRDAPSESDPDVSEAADDGEDMEWLLLDVDESHAPSRHARKLLQDLLHRKDLASGEHEHSAQDEKRELGCPGGHVLQPFKTSRDGYTCSICCGKFPTGTRLLSCRACDYDLCMSCHLQNKDRPDSSSSVGTRLLILTEMIDDI